MTQRLPLFAWPPGGSTQWLYGPAGQTLRDAFFGAELVRVVWAQLEVPAAPAGLVSVWNGTAWVDRPVKVWTGTAWVQKPLKRWTGTAWA